MPSGQGEVAVGRWAGVWAHRPALAVLAVFYAAYVLTGGFSEGLALIPGVSIRFWPPAGLFVAALLLTHRLSWPWWIATGCAAELTCNLIWFHSPLHLAVVYFAANAAAAVTAAVLIGLAAPPPFRLDSPREVVAFVLLGAGVAPVVSATAIAAADAALGKHPFATAWPLVWLGDATGLLVSTPLAVAAARGWRERTGIHPRRRVEAVVLAVLLFSAAVLGLRGYLPTVYVALPLVLWAAVRFQLPGGAAAVALLVLTTAAYTATGRGEFAGDPAEASARLVGLQTFLGVTAVSALVVAVLARQYQRAVLRLRRANADLEARVAERTADLQRSEQQLRLFIANAPAAIAMFDQDMRYLGASHRWQTDYQLTGEVIGRRHYEVFNVPERWKEVHKRALAGEVVRADEDRYVRADGSVQWQRWEVRPWHDAYGGVGGVIIATEDVTARKQAEQKLRASEERLRLTLEGANLGSWDVDLLTWQAVWNRRHANLLGYDEEPAPASFELWQQRVHPDDLGRVTAAIEAARRERALFAAEHRVADAAGRVRWLALAGRFTYDAAGRAVRFRGVSQDVTDRKQAEETGRAAEERFRRLLRVSNAGVVEMDAAGRMTLVNPKWCEMLGYAEAELLGRSVVEVTHESSVAATVEAVGRLAAGGPDFQIEKNYRRKDGSALVASSSVSALRGPDGTFQGLVAVVLDITARKEAEEALRDADRKKDEFLAVLAHELRNPLAPIRAAVEVLRRPGAGEPDLARARDIIDRQVRAMTRLIDDLMDVNRIRRGKIQLRRERVDLAAVVRAAVETSRPLIDDLGHTLTVDLPSAPIPLDADPVRLAQVVLNLLNNAAKYTEPGGRIGLTAERAGDEGVIRVTDTGIGIAADKLPTLFDMFTQVAGATDRSQGGLGIGLNLVKRLVEKHGGRIDARSDGPGKGSEFTVTLPVARTAEPGTRNDTPDPVPPAPHSAFKKVLVVDDNADAADSLAMLLELTGHAVRTAHDGEAAVAAADQFRPDVVLCDIGLPKLSGYEVCRRLRGQPWGRTLVLVAVTGRGLEADRQAALESGFDHHLTKPVDPTTVVALLAGATA